MSCTLCRSPLKAAKGFPEQGRDPSFPIDISQTRLAAKSLDQWVRIRPSSLFLFLFSQNAACELGRSMEVFFQAIFKHLQHALFSSQNSYACSSQAQTRWHVLPESCVDIPLLSRALVGWELHFSSANKCPSKCWSYLAVPGIHCSNICLPGSCHPP